MDIRIGEGVQHRDRAVDIPSTPAVAPDMTHSAGVTSGAEIRGHLLRGAGEPDHRDRSKVLSFSLSVIVLRTKGLALFFKASEDQRLKR